MELLSAALTGVFLYWFRNDCMAGYQTRAIKKAGPLLLRLKRRDRNVRYLLFALEACASISFWVFIALVAFGSPAKHFASLMVFAGTLSVAKLTNTYRQMVFSVEIRQHGILPCRRGLFAFMPWRKVKYCKWKLPRGRLFVQYLIHDQEYAVAPEQIGAATQVLRQFTEVRDETGEISPAELAPLDRPTNDYAQSDRSLFPEPEFRRLQFTLRTLLLLMLVASSAFSWLGIRYRRSVREEAALARLKDFSPSVSRFGWQIRLDFSRSSTKPGDKDLAVLEELSGLESLDLDGTNITDEGLRHVSGLTRLESLSLTNTKVTDRGLEHLRKLNRLRFLSLGGTAITDAGLVHLEHLGGLRHLSLYGTQVTEQGVRQLQHALPSTEISR